MRNLFTALIATSILLTHTAFASIALISSSLVESEAVHYSDITASVLDQNDNNIVAPIQLKNMSTPIAIHIPKGTPYKITFFFRFGDSSSHTGGDQTLVCHSRANANTLFTNSNSFDLENSINVVAIGLCNVHPIGKTS